MFPFAVYASSSERSFRSSAGAIIAAMRGQQRVPKPLAMRRRPASSQCRTMRLASSQRRASAPSKKKCCVAPDAVQPERARVRLQMHGVRVWVPRDKKDAVRRVIGGICAEQKKWAKNAWRKRVKQEVMSNWEGCLHGGSSKRERGRGSQWRFFGDGETNSPTRSPESTASEERVLDGGS